MGLFDNAFGSSKAEELTKQDAFAGILLAANASDGYVADEEVQGFFTILLRMKMYRDWTPDKLRHTIDRLLGMIKRQGVDKVLEACARALPEQLHRAAFANACDLILADGVVEDEEKQFIHKLRSALGLSGDDAQMIAQVMVYKNQG
ncbi:MAG TPA: tellurite resistance TerB family protein [Gemmataceae bacterium]